MSDELAEINGVKPKVLLQDGDERDVKSASSSSTYKVKRTWDHYYCTCPAWRNQGGVPVNARSCKHLRSLLGDPYEDARLLLRNPDGQTSAPKGKGAKKAAPKAPSKTTKAKSKSKRKHDDDEDEEEEETKAKPPAKRTRTRKPKEESEPEDAEDDAMDVAPVAPVAPAVPPATNTGTSDELAEINGIKPKVQMQDGEERDVKSLSSSSMYKVKRTWDHYYCTCPAWRNQGGAPVNARSCKHLRSLLGDDYEDARLQLKNPDGQPATRGKPASKRAQRVKKDADDDATTIGAPQLLLANKWDLEKGADPTGWWLSEKLDGVRTYYNGKRMFSRLGNPFTPPQWFLDKLPTDVTLDGELFCGRGLFQSTVSIVKTINSPHWNSGANPVTFQVFDIPSMGEKPFEARLAELKKMFGPGGKWACREVEVVEHIKVKNRDHVFERLKEVEALGGEGLMLREPKSTYEGTRSRTLLKVKTFHDAEALVLGHKLGSGKNKNVTGALCCQMESGKKFNVGSGLTDKQRKDPPKVGSIIVYRFQELTKDGVPRFPTFVGEAIDKKVAKDAVIASNTVKTNGNDSE